MAAGKLTKLESRQLLKRTAMTWNEYVLTATLDELHLIAEDPRSGAYQRVTAKALIQAVEEGNLNTLNWFFDRIHGKPATQVTIDASITSRTEEIKSMTTKQVIALIREQIPNLEGEDDENTKS